MEVFGSGSDPSAGTRQRLSWAERASLLTTAVLGLAVSVTGYLAMMDAEHLRQQERSSAAAREIQGHLALELARTVEAVRNAGLMVESHPQLPRASFLRYAEQLTKALPPVAILEWQPVVRGSEREAFEQAARAQGLTGYAIVEPGEGATRWLPAPPRERYVPVLYAWPEANAPLGFNLEPDATRMDSKREAAERGLPVASFSFPILKRDIQGQAIQGFSVTAPVRQPGLQGPSGTAGYLAAVIEIPPLLAEVTRRAHAAHMELWLFEGRQAQGQPLFAGRDGTLPAREGPEHALQARHTVLVAEKPWTLLLQPNARFIGPPSVLPAALLAMGTLATALLCLLVWRAQRQRAMAQQARMQVEKERARLANVVEGTQAATWEADLSTHIGHVNTYWERLCGHVPAGQVLGREYRWEQDCHPEDLPRVASALQAHLRGEVDHFEAEYRHRHASGRWFWVLSRGKVLKRTPEGRALFMAGTLMDIDARKAAEARILELNSTLEARVAQRGAELERALESLRASQEALAHAETRAALHTLMASAAHELQTPLGNGLISSQNLVDLAQEFSQRLTRGGLRRSELQHFVVQVAENAGLAARNLLRSVELVGRFRQVAADQGSEQRRSFDLAEMVRELLATLSPALRRTPHRVECTVPAGIVLDSYPGPLGQVLSNLINNALLHAFDPGQDGVVRIEASQHGDAVSLQVSDNGRGMDAPTRQRLFEPYFSTRIGRGGTGLGMTIVDTLVRKTLGGQLKVTSSPGEGTCFDVRLPLQAPVPPERQR